MNTDHGSYSAEGCEEGKKCHILGNLVSSGCRWLLRTDSQLFHSRWAIVAHSRAQLSIKHIEL